MNAEFQRIERRDKKAFLSDQRKDIEENNRMGKTRDFFKKVGDTKSTFHVKKSTVLEEKQMAEDEMVEWHHRCYGYEFELALGVGD